MSKITTARTRINRTGPGDHAHAFQESRIPRGMRVVEL